MTELSDVDVICDRCHEDTDPDQYKGDQVIRCCDCDSILFRVIS